MRSLFLCALVFVSSTAFSGSKPVTNDGVSLLPNWGSYETARFTASGPKFFDISSMLLNYDTGEYENPRDERTMTEWVSESDYYQKTSETPREVALYGKAIAADQATVAQVNCAQSQQAIIDQVTANADAQTLLGFNNLIIPGPIVSDNRNGVVAHEELLKADIGDYVLTNGGITAKTQWAFLISNFVDKSGQCHLVPQSEIVNSLLASTMSQFFFRRSDDAGLSNMNVPHRKSLEKELENAYALPFVKDQSLSEAAAAVKNVLKVASEDVSGQPPVMTQDQAGQLACANSEVLQHFGTLTNCLSVLANTAAFHRYGWDFRGTDDDCAWDLTVSDETLEVHLSGSCPCE